MGIERKTEREEEEEGQGGRKIDKQQILEMLCIMRSYTTAVAPAASQKKKMFIYFSRDL